MQTLKELGAYTFQAVLKNSFKRFAERPCFSFPGEVALTYIDVKNKITEIHRLLASLDITRGERLAIYARNSPQWPIAYFAIVSYGAIAVPLMADFTAAEVASCLEHAEVRCAFVLKNYRDKIPASFELLIAIEDFSLIRGNTKNPTAQISDDYEAQEDDVSTIIYTSGTTGRSKGVVLTNRNLVSNAVAGQYCHRVSKYDSFLSILPLAHVYEFTVGLMMPFMNGAHVVYLNGPPIPRILLPTLKIVRPSIMLAVPLIMEKIYKSQVLPVFKKHEKLLKHRVFNIIFSRIAGKKIKKALGGRIQFFGLGGAKLSDEIAAFLKRAGFPYAIGYGLTETAPLVAYSGPSTTKPGFIGFTAHGVETKIINKNDEGVGELVVKGPNVMKGYFKSPELTEAAFTPDGYFRTGDLFSVDKHGRYAIRGRLKSMILNANGENIYPEDIEFVLSQHEIVSEALVVEGENSSLTALIKLNDEKLKALQAKEAEKAENMSFGDKIGSAVGAVSESIAEQRERLLNEIKFFVNARVNNRSKIQNIEVVPEFEKTASGKIKRYLYNILGKRSNKNKSSETD